MSRRLLVAGAISACVSSCGDRGLELPPSISLGEELELVLDLLPSASDLDEAPRIDVSGLPPGAIFEPESARIRFTPDFTQGGRSWRVDVAARWTTRHETASVEIAVDDTIAPPPPRIAGGMTLGDRRELIVEQDSNDYLAGPGRAGRIDTARIFVPVAGGTFPVRVVLHGFAAGPGDESYADQIVIHPHDPDSSYWWGYAGISKEPAPPYTQRRVLHLLRWVLDTIEGADPERVVIAGASMGGAGAATIGLLHARHFAMADASIFQPIPRNHRPIRRAQLSDLWGAPDAAGPENVWDRMDLTRALERDHGARNQLLFTKHGKDDPLIHFGAVTHESPLTGRGFYAALEEHAIGHLSIWDEGAHGIPDPILGDRWWDSGWNPALDPVTSVRRDRAFVAFSRSSANEDPGDGGGTGAFDDEGGYAGDVLTPNDTRWNGAIAGALNRHLRWDGSKLVDEPDRFEVPLFLAVGPTSPAPSEGRPATGDTPPEIETIIADVTPRRTQRFAARPNEAVTYRFGDTTGTIDADASGRVTVPRVAIRRAATVLVLERR